MSKWFQGQLLLCLSIAILTFIALEILGMPYAQTLALLAGFTEFIPYAGPLIGAVPAVFVAGTQAGLVWALVVTLVYYAIQLCENNLLVPLIMKHAVGLSPISIMFGMFVGVSFPDTIHPVVGLSVTMVSLAFLPNYFNVAALLVYILLYIFTFRHGRRRLLKIRRESTGEPVPFSIIRFFLADIHQEVKSVVADEFGRFNVLLRPGSYYLVIDEKEPDGSYRRIYQSEVVSLSNGLWPEDVIVPAQSGNHRAPARFLVRSCGSGWW
jgi:hypothetical protein